MKISLILLEKSYSVCEHNYSESSIEDFDRMLWAFNQVSIDGFVEFGSFEDLFFKGILCNILVCLAVLSAVKLKEETAKLIMIFWCLFAFITTGFEHSVANMSLFSAALLYPHPLEISLIGFGYNLFWVTLGNIVGGCALGAAYYITGKK